MKEGISHQRGALYWKSFHIAHVNMQVEPHVQSTAFQGRHVCVLHSSRGTRPSSGGCMLSFIHRSLWQTWNRTQSLRRQTAVSASSKLRAHRVMYTHFLPFQREGDTSQSLSDRGSWDNSRLLFPAITPANQKERHPDCGKLGMCCAEEAWTKLQSLVIGYKTLVYIEI